MKRVAVLLAIGVGVAAVLWGATSIKTAGNIETSEQLVSTKATGKPPLVVSSTTLVANLNADKVDGFEGTALDTRLTNAELLLVSVSDEVTSQLAAKVPKTGQTVTIGAADDGLLERGFPWPVPRFTVNGDGTATDNLTGLIWLANASCGDTVGGKTPASDQLNWANALTWTNALAAGKCGLTDGSIAGAWRLPNVREQLSLVHYGFSNPAVPNTAGTGKCATAPCAFSGVEVLYWSSSTYADDTTYHWYVDMGNGSVGTDYSSNTNFVWPVRGGQ